MTIALPAYWGEIVTWSGSPPNAEMLAQLPDDGFQYELVEGVLISMPPPQREQARIQTIILTLLETFVQQYIPGGAVLGEAGYLLSASGEPDLVLAPDASYIAPGRQGERAGAYERLAPDLAIEIASPSQYRPEMVKKTRQYLTHGVRMVWLIWPNAQVVEVWLPDQETPTFLTAYLTIDGGDVLPGFICPVQRIF